MTIKLTDIQIDCELHPKIMRFLASGQESSSMDPLDLLKLEIAERLAQKVPELRLEYHKEAFLLAVEMKFTAIKRAFAETESVRVRSEMFAKKSRNEAERTLASLGLFTSEVSASKMDDDLPF